MPRNISNGYFALRWEVLKRDAFTCQYCGRSAPEVKLEVDHITPVSEGGKDTKENLVAACYSCNRGRSALSLRDKYIKHTGGFFEKVSRRIQVLDLIKLSPLTTSEIMRVLNMKRGNADMTLKRLREKGRITRLGNGKWNVS